MPDQPFILSAEVAEALDAGRPVVGLESTIISHGLPRPRNLQAAHDFEHELRDAGVTPATIAVLDGVPRIGLDDAGIERIANEDLAKASIRDLPVVAARGASAATTVAATTHLAALAGVRVFATGGLGGVHRGAATTFDESADLAALAEHPVAVVTAGVKSVLDIGATLERLETLSVPSSGTAPTCSPASGCPARRSPSTGGWTRPTTWRASPGSGRGADDRRPRPGLVVANPIPADEQWDPAEHDRVLATAFAAADAAKVRGKAVTPFLLSFIVTASEGMSLEVNLKLARNNVRVAGRIATAYAALRR